MSVAELRTAAAAEKIPTADELIARARALAPKLRERAVRPSVIGSATKVRGGISRFRADPRAAAETLGRLRARSRGGVRHLDRTRQVDLHLLGVGAELFGRSCLHPRAFPRRGAARRLEREQRRLHRHIGGADRQGHRRAGRLPPRWPLVMVQRLAAFAMDFDRRACLPRGRGSSGHAALSRAGVAGEAGRHLVLRRTARYGSITSVLDNVFVPEHRSVSFATLRDAQSPDRKSTPIRFTAPRSSPCIPMRCSGRRSVRRAAPTPISWNGRGSAISPTPSSPSPTTCRCR